MFQKDGSDCSVETQLQVAKDDRLVGRLPQKLKLQRPVTGLILFSSARCLSLSPCKTTACAVHCLLPHPVGFSRCQEPAPEKVRLGICRTRAAKQMVPAPLHKSGELTPVEKGVHPLWLYKDRKGRSGKSGVSSES